MGLERLYNIIIDVEDCEKKLAVLPTGIPLRSQVETDGKEGIRNLGGQLVREDKIKLYIAVRKGKSLLIRALRWLNTSQMRIGKPSSKSQSHRLQGQFVCFVCMDAFPKKGSGYPIRDFASRPGNRTNVPTSLGRVNPNTAADGDRTRRLAQHQAATRT